MPKYLDEEFKNIYSHTAYPGHPYAQIYTNSSRTFIDSRASGWLIISTGEDATIEYLGSQSVTKLIKNLTIGIPILLSDPQESLIGTFFELGLSFKYLALFLSKHYSTIDSTLFRTYVSRIYCNFIDALLGNSPFFKLNHAKIFR